MGKPYMYVYIYSGGGPHMLGPIVAVILAWIQVSFVYIVEDRFQVYAGPLAVGRIKKVL